MKILHITAKMDPKMGGVSQGVRTMVAGLTELGVENEVVTMDAPDASFLKDDVLIIHTPGEGKGPWCYNSNLASWLSLNLDRFNAVIVHGLWLYHGYALWKAIRGNKHKKKAPKFFVMPHGMLDPYFQLAKGRKLKALRNWCYWKLIERKVINEADGILFTCEMEQRLARQPFRPYQPKSEKIVGLGVENPPPFLPIMQKELLKKCPALGDNSYILFLSRVHEKKGIDLLIKAYKKIIDKPSMKSLPKLIIAGPGLETSYGNKIQKLILECPELRDRVVFAGMLTGDAKWGAFYGCDAFVLPSHQENFGIAVVEAMACSKPVLISNQVNIWKEIKASNAGMIEEDTLDGTQSLLESWQKLPFEEKQAMGLHAKDCFEKKFAMVPAAKGVLNALNI